MIIILGLIVLVAALVVAVAGVLGNGGSAHAVSHFSVLGYHVTGSAGTLFLAGIVVGAAGLLGLSLLLAGARRRHRRGSAATRRLRQSRRETAAVSQERDELLSQRDTARASSGSNLSNGTAPHDAALRPAGHRWSRVRELGHRLTPAQPSAQPDAPAGQPATEAPASASDPAVAVTSRALDAHANEPTPAE